jgi:hypothetical protein
MADIKRFLDETGLKQLVTNIKAEDAKVLEAAKAHAEGLGNNYDAAGSAATAEANAKAHADQLAAGLETKGEAAKVQGKLDEEVQARKDADAGLQSAIDGVSAVANKNKEDIAAIKDGTNGILAQAKADATEKANAVKADVDALAGKVGEVPEGSTVMGIITNIQENAYDDTEIRGLISGLDESISGLDENKADKEQVAKDIAAAVKVEEDARKEAVQGVQDEVDVIKGDYLKASDKEELEGKINLKADQSALDEVSEVANAAATKVELKAEEARAKGEEARIEGLVTAEADRAKGVEADFKSRIEAMEVFWDTTEDTDGVVNKLKEIQVYIESDETGAATMAGNIQKNTQDIAAMDEAYKAADTTLQENIDKLEGVVNGKAAQADLEAVEGRMDDAEDAIDAVEGRLDVVEPKVEALEGKMTTVEGAVATKVEQEAYNTKIAALEQVDAGLDERLQLVEAQLGDGENSVSELIADAKQEAIDAAAEDATAKANKALEDAKTDATNKDAVVLAEAQKGIDAVQGSIDAHIDSADIHVTADDKAKWNAAEAKAHEHGNKAELDKIADGDVEKWNAAEQNAKDYAKEYADGLNTTMTGKVDAVDVRVKTLEDTIVDKAEQEDLDGALERLSAVEEKANANASALAAFVRIENSEIDALFA